LIVLGIETSCDETAAAVVRREADGRGTILSSLVRAQLAEHAPYGGVVPEIAARAHIAVLDRLIVQAMAGAGVGFDALDGVAATCGPGLVGGLVVGATTAKSVALAASRPFVAVNHLEAHALTARLTDGIAFPYLALLVSGGHTQLLEVRGVGDYVRLGTTIDDALGEAFDKTAKLLGLPYPGGPAVERAAASGNPARFALPLPLHDRPGLDFSFAGLKTAVRLCAERAAPLSPSDVADLCASFQATVAAIVGRRAERALAGFRERRPGVPAVLVVAGGVAANGAIRAALSAAAAKAGARLVAAPLALCGDNAAMVAWAGAERLALGLTDPLDAPIRPRWPLDANAAPMHGGGRLGARA
jgi:N6-L-threonylcarbamoyladenine synthase